MKTSYFGGGGGGGGLVSSVFGRTGVVVATLNDYAASLVDNDSSVVGATVKDALETLLAAIPTVPVSSVFGRTGAVVAVSGDYTSTLVTNSSVVIGVTVSDALNTLNTAVGAAVPTSRTLTTTSPLRIDGGASADLSANRTLSILPVSNTTPGVAPVHAGAADVGKALIATATSSAWGTNFGAQNLVTTGFLSVGTSPAATGALRITNNTFLTAINGAFTLDIPLVGTVANVVTLGTTSWQTNIVSANTTTLTLTGGASLIHTATTLLFGIGDGIVAKTFGMTSSGAISGALFTIRGQDSTNVGGTAGAVLLRGGDQSGASGTRTGGAFDIRPGSGPTAGGLLRLLTGGGTARVSINDTGLGLYAKTPVAQAARVGQAVDSTTGTASGTRTFVDVTTATVADPAKINNNFATLVTNMWNMLELAVTNLGVTA